MASPSLLCALSCIPFALLLSGSAAAAAGPDTPTPVEGGAADLLHVPLAFEENVGQTDASVRFLARGAGSTLFLTEKGAILKLAGEKEAAVLGLELVGAQPLHLSAGAKQPGVSRYFVGDDASAWGREAAHHENVAAKEVYPGIDLLFYGTEQRVLEYDFIVAPGADPSVIAVDFDGAQSIALDAAGALVLKTAAGDVVQHAPVAWQEIDGTRRVVDCRYALSDGGEVRFELGAFDATRTLVIDPTLVYSSYLGGTGLEMAWTFEVVGGVAYVAGQTTSTNFPIPVATNAYDRVQNGSEDVFVTVFTPGQMTLISSTYIGGASNERPTALAVDGAGLARVCGWTDSNNFPVVASARMRRAGREGFVFMLSPYVNGNLALAHSAYIGGDGTDECWDLALDAGSLYHVTGFTTSTNFPTAGNRTQINKAGGADVFVATISPYTDAISFGTYLGGAADDYGTDIVLNSVGTRFIAGYTYSTNFPTTPGAYDQSFNGLNDTFVAKIPATGGPLIWSTFIGGADAEWTGSMAINSADEVVVIGQTKSGNFPASPGAYDTSYNGGAYGDAFVFKLNTAGNGRSFATFLGGTDSDGASGVAIDSTGNIFLCGFGDSTNFPTLNAVQNSNGGMWDAWCARMTSGGSLVWSSYFGGTANDAAFQLSLAPSANRVYYCGYFGSSNITTTANAFDRSFNGGTYDAAIWGFSMN